MKRLGNTFWLKSFEKEAGCSSEHLEGMAQMKIVLCQFCQIDTVNLKFRLVRFVEWKRKLNQTTVQLGNPDCKQLERTLYRFFRSRCSSKSNNNKECNKYENWAVDSTDSVWRHSTAIGDSPLGYLNGQLLKRARFHFSSMEAHWLVRSNSTQVTRVALTFRLGDPEQYAINIISEGIFV